MTDLDTRLRAAARDWQKSVDATDTSSPQRPAFAELTNLLASRNGSTTRRTNFAAVAASVCVVATCAVAVAIHQEQAKRTAGVSAGAVACLNHFVLSDVTVEESTPPIYVPRLTNRGPSACTLGAAPPRVDVIDSGGHLVGTLPAPERTYPTLSVARGASVSIELTVLLPRSAKLGAYRARFHLSSPSDPAAQSPTFTVELEQRSGAENGPNPPSTRLRGSVGEIEQKR